MKFDITRAWKDESYRQSLSEEQLSMLPANPAGELTDAELAEVAGGWDGGFGGFGSGFFGHGGNERNESVAVLCELNIFSLSVISNIAVLGAVNQICVKG